LRSHDSRRVGFPARSLAFVATCAVALGLLAVPAGATDGPVVVLMKTAASASIEAGDVASFTITVSNTGASAASNITITDVLPDSALSWAENPDVGACQITDDVLSCTVGVLEAGASFSVTVEATTNPDVCDVMLANTATVEVGNKLTLTASASIAITCPPPDDGCTLTQGFWKTHYPEAWPASVLSGGMTLGSVTYTAAQLAAIFNQPVRGNGLISLSHQLIAAKLNVGSGADPTSIQSAITAADALIGGLVVPPVGSGYLAPSTTTSLNTALTNFNEGFTGPGHCVDDEGEGEGE
jgi:uncharacterized repeat protein (TIGR01451 family)